MLLNSNSSEWITPDTWVCLISLMSSYVTSLTVEFHAVPNITPTPIVRSAQWTFYVSNHFQSHLMPTKLSALFISKSFENIYLNGRYEEVIVFTEDTENVLSLWTRSKIFEAIIIVPNGTHLNAYTWHPYSEHTCFNKPTLEVINVCHDGVWKYNLFPRKRLPKQFSGCPVYYQTSHSPPDNLYMNGIVSGREPQLMELLAKSINLSVQYKPSTLEFYDLFENGNGMAPMIYRGEIDFGFASLVLSSDFYLYSESLPSYRDQPIAWMLPLPKPQSRIRNIYSGFSLFMWAGIVTIAFVSGLLIMMQSRVQGTLWHWIDLVSVSVASPVAVSHSRFLRVFLLYFQFYSLHIAWFYQSTLLTNLVNPPMERQIDNPQEALDANLPVFLYGWMQFSFNKSDHDLWNRVLSPQNHVFTYNIPYDKIVNDKSAFLLGVVVRDGWELRRQYHRNLANMVHLSPFLNSPIAIYAHRGAPLTLKYFELMHYAIESGIFWHLTVLERGYTDLPSKRITPSAETLQIEPLQGAFLLLAAFLAIAILVFCIEVCHFTCKKWIQDRGSLGIELELRKKRKIKIVVD